MSLKGYFEKQYHLSMASFAAVGRQGSKEISQMLPAFPGQSIGVVEEPGTPGNPTSHEVWAQKHEFEQRLDRSAERVPAGQKLEMLMEPAQ